MGWVGDHPFLFPKVFLSVEAKLSLSLSLCLSAIVHVIFGPFDFNIFPGRSPGGGRLKISGVDMIGGRRPVALDKMSKWDGIDYEILRCVLHCAMSIFRLRLGTSTGWIICFEQHIKNCRQTTRSSPASEGRSLDMNYTICPNDWRHVRAPMLFFLICRGEMWFGLPTNW
jgi:hypothetical protein